MADSHPIRRVFPFQDLTGRTFGRLTVVSLVDRTNTDRRWLCRCECGGQTIAHGKGLKSGNTKSCGCYAREQRLAAHTTHGKSRNPLFHIWHQMRERCRNPKVKHYDRYGGRGIQVCERWSEFANFLADMGERPSSAHSLDRINNDGNYEPDNCRWATTTEQTRNASSNRLVTAFGETRCISEWAEIKGVGYAMLLARIDRGWDPEEALTKPQRKAGSKIKYRSNH